MTETTAPAPMDLAVSFPERGAIRLQSRTLLAEPGNDACRRFLERVFQASEIEDVTINSPRGGGEVPHADLRFRPEAHKLNDVVNRISGFLDPGRGKNGKAAAGENGRTPREGRDREHHGVAITKVTPVRNAQGRVRFFRYGSVVTDWEIKHELPGRLRLKNPAIHRKAELCQAIERELMSVLGVDSYKTNALTSTVLVKYDAHALTRDQVIEIIDGALAAAEHPEKLDRPDLHLPLCTVSMPVAAIRRASSWRGCGNFPAASSSRARVRRRR